MRGVVSLAAALALPIDFPDRNLVIFLTFAVILATLVGQGLTLPFLISRLGIENRGGLEARRRRTPGSWRPSPRSSGWTSSPWRAPTISS